LHEGIKCVDVCAHTKNPKVRVTLEKEHNYAQKLKNQRSKIGFGRNPHLATSNKPRTFHEAKEEEILVDC